MILRLIISFFVYCFLGWLLCDIDPEETYSWYSGIWHGLFVVPNFLRHLFYDALVMANHHTTAYSVFYWITAVFSVISFIFGGGSRQHN